MLNFKIYNCTKYYNDKKNIYIFKPISANYKITINNDCGKFNFYLNHIINLFF